MMQAATSRCPDFVYGIRIFDTFLLCVHRSPQLSPCIARSFILVQYIEEDALPLCERSLAVQEKVLGQNHPHVAQSLHLKGKILYDQVRTTWLDERYKHGGASEFGRATIRVFCWFGVWHVCRCSCQSVAIVCAYHLCIVHG